MTEMQLAYNMLKAALDGSKPCPGIELPDTNHWWSLFRLLQRNRVAALCYEAAATAGAPRTVLMPWLAEHEKAVDWHRHQRQVQQDIIDTMVRHGIETLVLKGTHIAQYYPTPELREFGDLDLYFYDKHDEADRVAQEVLKVDVSNDAHHHSKYNYRGVTVESHYDFVNVHYPPSNRRYEALLKGLAPSPTFEVLFLLRHMACHFASSRITLRELTDWALTCQALQGEVDWKRVQQSVDGYGMRPFASALNLIAERQLGTVLPLQNDNNPDILANTASLERDIVYGSPETDDKNTDGLGRLTWKMRRWNALAWKRKMVYSDSPSSLMLASLTSHAEKPRSILHKQ